MNGAGIMNRAFVKEGDGWHICAQKRESCLYADEKGNCILETCRVYGEDKKEE